jgi:hypothetical protein
MTSLTERYLAAALRGVPEKQRADVERELRSSIADATDDRVAAGQERAEAETAVLEGFGDPALLAAGITGRPLYLIGPNLFVQYRQLLVTLLSIVVPIVGVVQAAVKLGTGGGYGDALIAGIGGALTVAVHLAFWVTLAFALVERVDSATWDDSDLKEFTGPWSVKRLPQLPASGGVTVGETVGDVLTGLLGIGGLIFLRGFSWLTDGNGDPVPLLHPELWSFWLPALIAVLASLVGFEIVKLLVGRWTMPLAVSHAVLQLALAVPFVALALTGSLINPEFATEIGWPPLAEGNGPVMLAFAAGVLLVTGWEIFDGFRRARRS